VRPLFPSHVSCTELPSMTVTVELLYEEDFYAWTQQQAGLLRRLPVISNELDVEHIAEEIEDLGRGDLRTAQSLCEQIVEHFSKLNIRDCRILRTTGVTRSSNGGCNWKKCLPAALQQSSIYPHVIRQR